MCRIRIIKKTSNGAILKDIEHDFSMVTINPIDRPAYITYHPIENGFMSYHFTYIVKNEELSKFVISDLAIFNYGQTSGRIMNAELKRGVDTSILYEKVQQSSILSNLSLRGQDNFRGYLEILCEIINKM